MNFIKTDEKIIETIASIAKRGGSLQKDIHRAACSILNRWCVTEDVSTATKHMNMLLDALPVMVRSNAFKDWGVHMAGLVWSEDDTFAYHAKRTKITVEQVQAAKAKPFWEFKPEPKYQPTDADAMFLSLIESLERKAKKGVDPDKGDKMSDAQIAYLKQAYAAMPAYV